MRNKPFRVYLLCTTMKKCIVIFGLVIQTVLSAQSLYFPPLTGNTWETMSPTQLNWCPDSLAALIDYVGSNNSKAFLILKEGKMVSENYYGTFTADSFWYWASAGKTVTAFLIGQAQQEGLLDIQQPSSIYQGSGWTTCTPEQEQEITVWHQLTMTTGLDYTQGDYDCTDPGCLPYLHPPGTHWFYHNAPYTLLDAVIEGASNLSFNQFYNTRLKNRIGMNGLFLQSGSNNVNFSNARSMARFGLLMLNSGVWASDTLMNDQVYFNQMVNTSQEINKAYGYLWWLNGKESFRYPDTELTFPGFIMPDAPEDLYAGLGKNGQYLLIVPSQNMVVVRMGNPPNGLGGLVPTVFANEIMKRIGRLECLPTSIEPTTVPQEFQFWYNRESRTIHKINNAERSANLLDLSGRLILTLTESSTSVGHLSSGVYIIQAGQKSQKMVIH